MPIYSSSPRSTVEAILSDQLQDAANTTISNTLTAGTINVDTLTVSDGPLDIKAQANFKNSGGTSYMTIDNSTATIAFPNNTNAKTINVVDSGGSTSYIQWTSSGDMISNVQTNTKGFYVKLGASERFRVQNASTILTSNNLQIPNGRATSQGGILFKGNTLDTWAGVTSGSNGFVLDQASTTNSISFSQNGTTMLSVAATTGDTIVAKNFNMSNNAADKVMTFTNSGGNSTITSTNTNGNLTTNTPSGSAQNFSINGTTLASLQTPSAGTLGLTLTNCPINLSTGSGYGLQLPMSSSGQFKIETINYGAYLSTSQGAGNIFFQCTGIDQLAITPDCCWFKTGLRFNPTTITSSPYTALLTDSFLLVNAATPRTINLPYLQSSLITIIRQGANTITITPTGGCTINGSSSSQTLTSNYQCMKFFCDSNLSWMIV